MALTIEPTTPFNMGAAPQNQVLHNNWLGDQRIAVLYVFAPSMLMDQVRRPHVYSFTGEVMPVIQDAMGDFLKGNSQSIMDVAKSALLNQALFPTPQGAPLPTKQLSDLWMFLLLLDNVSPRTIGGMTGGSNRLVYMGYCSDEPINTLGLRATPNPHCFLHVTHRTQFSINETIQPYGAMSFVRPEINADVLNGKFYSQLSGDNNAFLLHPKKLLLNGMSTGEQDYLVSTNLHVGSLPNAEQISSDMRSPDVHMNTLINALQYTVRNQMNVSIMQPSLDRTMIPVHDLNTAAMTFAECLGNDVPNHIIGIDSSRPISIAGLNEQYPNLQIIPYKAPSAIIGSPLNPTSANPITLVSSYLSDTIPSVMTNLGIGSVVFRYSSIKLNHEAIFLNEEPEVRVEHIEPFVPEDINCTKRRWDQFLAKLQRDVFPRIVNWFGHFQVTVNSSANAANYIQVQLMGRGTYCNPDEFLITHNPIGGLSTPLMGTPDVMSHNFDELSKLLTTVIPDAPFNISI